MSVTESAEDPDMAPLWGALTFHDENDIDILY
jgi:hypothetical protein